MCPPKTSTVFLKYWKYSLVVCFITLSSFLGNAQELTDSTFLLQEDSVVIFEEVSNLDPNKSAVYSAILPGLGQVYNGQYWKVPIIYGAFLGLFHGIRYNHQLYSDFKNALRAEADNDPNTINPFTNVDETRLRSIRDRYQRDRDFLIIITTIAYLINIVEAHVAAHLHEFKVNKSLSMNLEPKIESSPLFSRSMGVSLTFNF